MTSPPAHLTPRQRLILRLLSAAEIAPLTTLEIALGLRTDDVLAGDICLLSMRLLICRAGGTMRRPRWQITEAGRLALTHHQEGTP